MPKWGLTRAQRYARPWNLPSDLLAPAKTITDPVHGDIFVTKLEQLAIDSPPLQRLRRIKQLGTSHLVYPGATHTRFSHVLGAMRVAQDLVDAVVDTRNGPRPTPDLLAEWDPTPEHVAAGPSGPIRFSDFDRCLAEVTVLARLGGLLHDLCHVPFGHTIEDDLGVLEEHDSNFERFDKLWDGLNPDFLSAVGLSDGRLASQLKPLIISKTLGPDGKLVPHNIAELDYPFVADIVGNTICADLIDYLQRDHLFAGLPAAIGHRFANDFYVSPSSEVHFPGRMVIRIARDGHERPDVTTELLKFLRYRYELSERVLVHHAKLAADAMVGKLLEMWHDAVWTARALAAYPEAPEGSSKDISALAAFVEEQDAAAPENLNALVRAELEQTFTTRGDDGLLEELSRWGVDDPADKRKAAIRHLADAVLNRQFFKPIGRAESESDRGLAEKLHDRFGKPRERRKLEQDAAHCAGLANRWAVVLWLPAPKMRLKVAGVLVDTGGQINALDQVGNERADDIYRSHEALWGISVFADSQVVDQPQERTLLAFLGQHLGVRFRDRSGIEVPELRHLAVQKISSDMSLAPTEVGRLAAAADAAELAAHGFQGTFVELVEQVRQIGLTEAILVEDAPVPDTTPPQ